LQVLGVAPARIAEARAPALMWALERASRSGRVAWQFARDYRRTGRSLPGGLTDHRCAWHPAF